LASPRCSRPWGSSWWTWTSIPVADIAGDIAIAVRVGGGVPTINLRVDYLRPGTGTFLEARATVRRLGRTIATADIDVFDDQERLCAIGRGTYSSVVG